MNAMKQKRIPEKDIDLLKEFMRLTNLEDNGSKQNYEPLMANKQQFYQLSSYFLAAPYLDHINELRAELGLDPV